MNALADWLRRSGQTRINFARKIGISPSYLTQLCRTNPLPPWPSRSVAERIFVETAGEITPIHFLRIGIVNAEAAE